MHRNLAWPVLLECRLLRQRVGLWLRQVVDGRLIRVHSVHWLHGHAILPNKRLIRNEGLVRVARGRQPDNRSGIFDWHRSSRYDRACGREEVFTTIRCQRGATAQSNARRIGAAVVASAKNAGPSRKPSHRTKAGARLAPGPLLVRPHGTGNEDEGSVDGGEDVLGRVVGQGDADWLVATQRRAVVWKFGVLFDWHAKRSRTFPGDGKGHPHLHVADVSLGGQSPVDGGRVGRACRDEAVAVGRSLFLGQMPWLSRGQRVGDGLMHIMCPLTTGQRIGRTVQLTERVSREMTR